MRAENLKAKLTDDVLRFVGERIERARSKQVEDFASEEVLADLGIEDPFELTGLYEGIALTERSIEHSGTMPDRIFLYRRALLDEWAEHGELEFEALITHVLVHEVGHHFGLSDEAMHALEEAAG